MELTQLNQRIAVANAESKRLNNERAVNIGKRETLEKQLNDAIHLYNETYNSSLDVNSLNAEIEKVAKEKEQEVSNIETVLGLIKSGKFDEAQARVSGNSVEPVVSSNSSSEVTEQSGVVPNISSNQIPNLVPNVAEPAEVVTSPVQGVNSIPEPNPVPNSVPKTPTLSGLDTNVHENGTIPNIGIPTPVNTSGKLESLDDMLASPPNIGKPPVLNNKNDVKSTPSTPESPITSFNAILGGSQFKPQGDI